MKPLDESKPISKGLTAEDFIKEENDKEIVA